MRVTKTVREYVENQIREKAEQSLAELKKRADDAKEAYEKDKKVADEKYSELYNELVYRHHIDVTTSHMQMHLRDDMYRLPDVIAYNDACCKVRSKINSIVTEILATMELGGTKAELLDMINKVEF